MCTRTHVNFLCTVLTLRAAAAIPAVDMCPTVDERAEGRHSSQRSNTEDCSSYASKRAARKISSGIRPMLRHLLSFLGTLGAAMSISVCLMAVL
jgi:hypothetical protein